MLTVYSKPNCPYCDKAKHLLTTANVMFDTVDIAENQQARQWLMEQGHRSVPQIYKNGLLFVEGGYAGLAALSSEELKDKINQ